MKMKPSLKRALRHKEIRRYWKSKAQSPVRTAPSDLLLIMAAIHSPISSYRLCWYEPSWCAFPGSTYRGNPSHILRTPFSFLRVPLSFSCQTCLGPPPLVSDVYVLRSNMNLKEHIVSRCEPSSRAGGRSSWLKRTDVRESETPGDVHTGCFTSRKEKDCRA